MINSIFIYFRKAIIIAGWVLLIFLAYKVSQFDYESASFDPYDILNVPIVSISPTKHWYNNCIVLGINYNLFREQVKKLLKKLIEDYH